MNDRRLVQRPPAAPGPAVPLIDDRADLEAAARGDRAAFEAIYARHVSVVYRHAYSLLGTRQDAEEAVQDVFVTMWGKVGGIRIVDRSVLPWLLATSRFVCLNRRRALARQNARQHRDGLVGLPPDPLSVEDRAHTRLLREAIDDAVRGLSDEDYRLYALCLEEGLSYEEAAAAMGVSHGAVRNRLSRLRAGLRRTLGSRREELR